MKYPESIDVRGEEILIKYLSSKGLNSSVRINNGVVQVRISRFLLGKSRDKTVENFLSWAKKKFQESSKRDFVNPVYKDGSRICTHNKIYELRVQFESRKRSSSILQDDYLIEVRLDDTKRGEVKNFVDKIIIKDQTSYLRNVVNELNSLYFKEEIENVRFKRVSSRFGSCSSKRNINIAYRLLFAPREVFRYVCVHELAHLKEFNHSRNFWSLVGEACPEYMEHEKWLKTNGFLLG